MIDFESFQKWAEYCEEKTQIKQLNAVVMDNEDALNLITEACKIGKGNVLIHNYDDTGDKIYKTKIKGIFIKEEG